jgi:hypothetical protein
MRAMVVLLLSGALLVGCKHPKASSSAAASGSSEKRAEKQPSKNPVTREAAKATPLSQPTGKIASVNPSLKFVVIDFAPNPLPQVDQRLGVYRQGQKVGVVKISGQARNSIVAADITEGDAQSGDEVHSD